MGYDYQTADPYYYGLLKTFSKENKKFQTEAECFLWECLRGGQLGVRFKRQHIIKDYIVDFICLEKNLIIEVDGGYHSQEKQIEKDEYRTSELNRMGFDVIRFENDEIIGNIEEVLSIITEKIR